MSHVGSHLEGGFTEVVRKAEGEMKKFALLRNKSE
jgi:hypothetical protein